MSEFKTIGQVSDDLNIPQHVLRYWESEFSQIKPLKRKGGRRFYNEEHIKEIEKIRTLLHVKGYTIKGAKKALNNKFMVKSSKQIEPDPNQIELFEALENVKEEVREDKIALKQVLHNLKEMKKVLES